MPEEQKIEIGDSEESEVAVTLEEVEEKRNSSSSCCRRLQNLKKKLTLKS